MIFQDSENLVTAQATLAEKFKIYNQEGLPYVIFRGEVPNLQFFVCFNGSNYSFNTATAAVESCYKCLDVLETLPYSCEHVWMFFDKAVYQFSHKKKNGNVTTFASLLTDYKE